MQEKTWRLIIKIARLLLLLGDKYITNSSNKGCGNVYKWVKLLVPLLMLSTWAVYNLWTK